MYRRVVFPALCRFDAEEVHDQTLGLLSRVSRSTTVCSALRRLFQVKDPRLISEVFGLTFDNPFGLAAGFDKNAVAVPALAALGFGHIEIGTVTPLPQEGKPRPRVFRLVEDRAIINRMGFPGVGSDTVELSLRRSQTSGCAIGINVGANQESVNAGTAAGDYVEVLEQLYVYGSYFAINVSSPNTAKLRGLQGKEALASLLDQVLSVREKMRHPKPILVKVAPDLLESEINDILDVVTSCDTQGIIATNTTVARPRSLRSPHLLELEAGGLSGEPLSDQSNRIIRRIYRQTKGELPIIGVGGVFTTEDALEKIKAGASLVQAYTGFVYEGPLMPRRINRGIAEYLDREGLDSIADLVGVAV